MGDGVGHMLAGTTAQLISLTRPYSQFACVWVSLYGRVYVCKYRLFHDCTVLGADFMTFGTECPLSSRVGWSHLRLHP